MSEAPNRLILAEAHSASAREKLSTTLATLQPRLEPRRLVEDAKRELVGAGGQAAQRSVAALRARPGVIAGAAAATVLFLARHRVAALLGRPRRIAGR